MTKDEIIAKLCKRYLRGDIEHETLLNKIWDAAEKSATARAKGLVNALKEIENSYKSPPWDKPDYENIARRALEAWEGK